MRRHRAFRIRIDRRNRGSRLAVRLATATFATGGREARGRNFAIQQRTDGGTPLATAASGHEQVVGSSCKAPRILPLLPGPADTAVHLERSVLPAVPVRHWICSPPWGLRALLGYDRVLAGRVATTFINELARSLKKRAKESLKLHSVSDVHTGSALAVQRTDSALRLNVHFHVLALVRRVCS